MGKWNWPLRVGDSSFGSSSTAEEVTEGIDASHLTAIVTGATNGIGKETARVLALRGAKVVIPCRTLENGMKVRQGILEQIPTAEIHVMEMDLSSLDSVNSFACSFSSANKHLNILINNAGIMACPFQLSKDGIELQFATNHLGHFHLTLLLLDKMKATAEETRIQGRVINVSSICYKWGDGSWFELNKMNNQSRYRAYWTYVHTKLANVLFTNELARKLKEDGSNVTANSLHPGIILTEISRYVNSEVAVTILSTLAKPFIKSIAQGAATTCYVSLHHSVTDVTGKYFENCNMKTLSVQARNEDLGKKLWEFSEELIKRN